MFRIRGTLGAVIILACNGGALFGYAIPLWLGYYSQIKAHLMIPIVFLVFMHFFPETPEYLLKRNQQEVCLWTHTFRVLVCLFKDSFTIPQF